MDTQSRPYNSTSKEIGTSAEKLALSYLNAQGLKKITSNYACRYGEIDLVMQDNKMLVFIEVRYRKSSRYGSGAETVDFRKQQKILKSADHFLQKHPKLNKLPCRIDVLSIGPEKTDIDWIPNAIEN